MAQDQKDDENREKNSGVELKSFSSFHSKQKFAHNIFPSYCRCCCRE
jgi:hypothetical protein